MTDQHRFHPSHVENPYDPDYGENRATRWTEDHPAKYTMLVVAFWITVIILFAYFI